MKFVRKLEGLLKYFGIRIYLGERPFNIYVVKKKAMLNHIIETLIMLSPQDCGWELIRVGGINDGGYFIPNDIKNISVCFSAGVGGDTTFENQLESYGIRSYLLDRIEGHPKILGANQLFLPKWLGLKTEADFVTLSDWVLGSSLDKSEAAMLKMDIEGSEWGCLQVSNRDTIERFQIIVIEFHSMDLMLEPKIFYEIYRPILKKMTDIFDVIYVHPNNCCGTWQVREAKFPCVLEVTFHRKDRRISEPVLVSNISSLDTPNLPENSEITIDWMGLTNNLV